MIKQVQDYTMLETIESLEKDTKDLAANEEAEITDAYQEKINEIKKFVTGDIMQKSISQLVKLSHEAAKSKGWWEEPKTPVETLALVITEITEAIEEIRNGHEPNETYYSGKIKWNFNDGTKAGEMTIIEPGYGEVKFYDPEQFGTESLMVNKPEGIPSEIADAIIRLCDFCGYYGIDIEHAIQEKMEYNKSRGHKHGGKKL